MSRIYNNFKFKIPEYKILARMGYLRGMTIPVEVERKIKRVEKLGYLLSEPIGAVQDFEIVKNDGEVVELRIKSRCIGKESSFDVSGKNQKNKILNFEICSKDVAKMLKGCKQATLLVCTIGDKLTSYLDSYQQQGEIASAMMIDSFGSEAVEEVAEEITRNLARIAKKDGYELTFRFACGYGDWDLKDQKKILATINALELNIHVGRGGIMEPRKSITGVIGWKKVSK